MKQSEMRFDPPGPPGHYGSEYNRRRGSHIVKRKIDLPTKEPVELRKADKRWVRPQDADGILGESEKETQVGVSWTCGLCLYSKYELLKPRVDNI